MLNSLKNGNAPLSPMPKNFIATMELFKDLPPEVLREIERVMVEKTYPKGSSIFLEDDPAEYVWFVKEGHVKAVIHSVEGKDLTVCMVGANGMFGTCCCLEGGKYPCNGMAETEVTVVAYPLKHFLELMGKYPSLSKEVVRLLSKKLRQSKDQEIFGQESVEKRILHVLVSLVSEFGNTIPLTRREIAEMAGTTVETSIRTFSAFEKEGLVVTSRGRIVVKNLKELVERLGAD